MPETSICNFALKRYNTKKRKAPSSNGLGHWVLIPKIVGSNPTGVTQPIVVKMTLRLGMFGLRLSSKDSSKCQSSFLQPVILHKFAVNSSYLSKKVDISLLISIENYLQRFNLTVREDKFGFNKCEDFLSLFSGSDCQNMF